MMTSGSSYVASKLGLIKFMEILAAEHTDIHITTIHPGVIETDMFQKSEMTEMPLDKSKFSIYYLEYTLH
jgi:NAD(P)-dependent dehydrogenase (short-subunit alcohol dehydrogenase family)